MIVSLNRKRKTLDMPLETKKNITFKLFKFT